MSGSDDGNIFVWEAATGLPVLTLKGDEDIVNCCLVRESFAVACSTNPFCLRLSLFCVDICSFPFFALQCHPSEFLLVSSGIENNIKVWSSMSGDGPCEERLTARENPTGVVQIMSENNGRLAVASAQGVGGQDIDPQAMLQQLMAQIGGGGQFAALAELPPQQRMQQVQQMLGGTGLVGNPVFTVEDEGAPPPGCVVS